jgi:hypothetical protein
MDAQQVTSGDGRKAETGVGDEFEFSPLATPDDTQTDEKITIVGMIACR